MKRFASVFVLGLALLSARPIFATPFVEAGDTHLRSSIQMLADGGYLKGPVNSFPLGWASIARDIRLIDPSDLNPAQYEAYLRVIAALEYNKRGEYTGVRIQGATASENVTGFSDARFEQGSISLIKETNRGGIVARVQTNFRYEIEGGEDVTMDGSYVGYVLGNWGLTLDQLPMWWGPGQDQALVYSTNSRPIQALRFTRIDNAPIDLPLLDKLGWWHTSAFIGNSQDMGAMGRYTIAGVRIANSLFDGLETGVGYTGQWGGKTGTNDSSSDAFSDFISFTSTPDIRNRFASLDFRWSPVGYGGFYGEYVISQKGRRDTGLLLGADFRFAGGSLSEGALTDLFIEVSHVDVIYEDAQDPNGYTRWGRNTGAAMGQDADGLVFGYNRYTSNGHGIEVRLRFFELGPENERVREDYLQPQNLDATSGLTIERTMIDVSYQHPFSESVLRVGVQAFDDTLVDAVSFPGVKGKTDVSAHVSWEWRW